MPVMGQVFSFLGKILTFLDINQFILEDYLVK